MKTILVVDDEPDTLTVLELLLRHEGFEVRTASDGVEALEQIRDEPPDLVLTDFMMPRMDGLELCRQIRQMGLEELPIVMTSAAARLPARNEHLYDVGLNKPVDFNRLLAIVHELVSDHNAH